MDPQIVEDSTGYQVVVATVISMVISTGAVILRFWSRKVQGLRFDADDYLILTALFFKYGIDITGLVMIQHGLGRHISTVAPGDVTIFLKILYTGPFLFALTIMFVKLSILNLYRKLFIKRYLLIMNACLVLIVVVWGIGISLTGIFNCIPVRKSWDTTVPGQCIDLVTFYYAIQIPNVITDIAILLLPVPAIWSLPLDTHKKISLVAMFTVGGITAAFDIVRLVVLLQVSEIDITFDSVHGAVWTDLEPGIAILAACLPVMKPLLRKLYGNKQWPDPSHRATPSSEGTLMDKSPQIGVPSEAGTFSPL